MYSLVSTSILFLLFDFVYWLCSQICFFNWIYFEPIFVILLQNLTFLNQCFCHAFEFSHYISDIYINLLTLSRHWVDLISLLHYFLITVYSSVWPLIIFKRKALNVFSGILAISFIVVSEILSLSKCLGCLFIHCLVSFCCILCIC